MTGRPFRTYTALMRLSHSVAGRLLGVLACVCLCAVSGCAIFGKDQSVAKAANENMLPQLKAPMGAIQLEVMFVERPVNDPLLGRSLWSEMDLMAGIPADRLMELYENGFRIGLAGTEPPPTLAALLDAGRIEDYDEVTGFWTNRRVALRRGAKTDVFCSNDPRPWSIDLSTNGTKEQAEFDKALGVLHIDLEDIRDGWVKLHIQPEVHHGEEAARREATENSWSLSSGKKVKTLNSTGFDVHLSLNEMLVISADDSAKGKAGNHFFRREDDGRLMQRVVLLRVADLTRFEMALR